MATLGRAPGRPTPGRSPPGGPTGTPGGAWWATRRCGCAARWSTWGGEASERPAAAIGDDTGDRRVRRGLPHGVGRRDVPPVHEGPPADGEPRGHRAQAHGAGRLRRPLPRRRRVRPGQRGREGGPWRHRRAWARASGGREPHGRHRRAEGRARRGRGRARGDDAWHGRRAGAMPRASPTRPRL